MKLRELIRRLDALKAVHGDVLEVTVVERTSHGTRWRSPNPGFVPAEDGAEDDDRFEL